MDTKIWQFGKRNNMIKFFDLGNLDSTEVKVNSI